MQRCEILCNFAVLYRENKKEPEASIPQISYTLKRVKKCRNEGYLSSHPTGVGFGGSGIRRRVATLGYFWLSLSHALFFREKENLDAKTKMTNAIMDNKKNILTNEFR